METLVPKLVHIHFGRSFRESPRGSLNQIPPPPATRYRGQPPAPSLTAEGSKGDQGEPTGLAAGGAQRGSERPLPRCTATPAQAGTRTTAEARMPSEPDCRGGGKAERGRSAKRRRNAPLCPARDLARGTTTSPLSTGQSPVGGHLTRTRTSSRHPRVTRRQRLSRIPRYHSR